jgi:hypothetical protein
MEKKNKFNKFLKNRTWRSKIAHRLKGDPKEVCRAFLNGHIDKNRPLRSGGSNENK